MPASFPTNTWTAPENPVLFICDLQEKFRPAIHEFSTVLATANKLIRAASLLDMPIVATTQQRAKLGETCAELGLDSTHPTAAHIDKSAFSMWVPGVVEAVEAREGGADVLLVGIETHICVLQTSLDLLAHGHRVWIVQDGVSSCNPEERAVALERLRQEGARVTTSESVIYECLGDAGDKAFRGIAALVKETKESTREGLRKLCGGGAASKI